MTTRYAVADLKPIVADGAPGRYSAHGDITLAGKLNVRLHLVARGG